MAENNNKEVLDAIRGLASHMDERFKQAEELNSLRFAQLEKTLEERITDLRKDITLQFEGVHKRLDLANKRIDKLYIAVDGFVVLHKKLDQELTALRSKYDRLEERIGLLETKFAIA